MNSTSAAKGGITNNLTGGRTINKKSTFVIKIGNVQTLPHIGALSPMNSIGIYAFKYPIDDLDLS